jgi:prephenate dehydratase
LGPPGTFGEEAALRVGPREERLPFPSHAAVAAAVESGAADLGVVGIENSLSGSVGETLDILIHDTRLQIQSELLLPIEHNLILKPGANPADVKVIYSHPAAPGQCRRYIEAHFPKAQIEAALSTAEAVRLAVARGSDAAAIASDRAAELLGGEVFARGIQDSNTNVTRFVVLGRGAPAPTGRDRTSIAFTFNGDAPGSLAGVLNVFARLNINCSKIESRPTRSNLGEYVFLVDFDGHRDQAPFNAALAEVRALCAELKVFGSYPRSH